MKRLESMSGELDLIFPEYDSPPPCPGPLLVRWLEFARRGGVREPTALALTTVSAQGIPSSRIIIPIAVEGEVIRFSTHDSSRKGIDMLATGRAAGLFYWRELGRQIAFCARAERAPDAEADAAWAERPPAFDPISSISRQSMPLNDLAELQHAAARFDSGVKLPRPARFVVFRLTLTECEFWSGSASRLHKRLKFNRITKGWAYERLQP